jgi:hypothetical protein
MESNTISKLADEYGMNLRTFRVHVREVLVRRNCLAAKNNTHLSPEVINDIRILMGDCKNFRGSATMTELASCYGMCLSTFQYRIRKIKPILRAKLRGKRGLYILSSRDIEAIMDVLGPLPEQN